MSTPTKTGFQPINGHSPKPFTDPRIYHAHIAKWDKDGKGHFEGDPIHKGHPGFIMSRSALADFGKCPRKWILAPKEDPTKAMKDGSLVDTLFLSPNTFDDTYTVSPAMYPVEKPTAKDPRTEKPWNNLANYCKEWNEARKAEGKEVCTADDVAEGDKAIHRLRQDELISQLMQHSDRQVFLQAEWHDAATGLAIPFKCLIDILPHSAGPCGKMIADFKRTNDAEPDKWERRCFDQEHYYQAAVYLDIVNAVTGYNYTEFVNVISESEPPYEPARRRFTQDFISLGRARYQRDLAFYCHCLKEDKWPGYEDMDPNNPHRPVIDGWRAVDTQPWMIKKFE